MKGLYVWGEPLWVNADRSMEKISEEGETLARRLNHLTAQAESAIQDNNPVQYFLRHETLEPEA